MLANSQVLCRDSTSSFHLDPGQDSAANKPLSEKTPILINALRKQLDSSFPELNRSKQTIREIVRFTYKPILEFYDTSRDPSFQFCIETV